MSSPSGPIGPSARKGARSSLVAQGIVQIGSIASTMVIARILTRTDFGVIALAQSLMGAASLIGLAGITAAIVTAPKEVERKAATYFWAALLVGSTMGGAIALLAPLIVSLLGQNGTAPYVQVLALTIPLSLMTLVPQALLQRWLRFSRMNLVTVLGSSVYFISQVALALAGWGAWAVITGQVLGASVSLITGLFLAGWFPKHRPRIAEIREDLRLIGSMGLSSFFGYVGKNADYWVTSRFLGPAQLGVYYIAYVLPSIIRVRLSGIFRQVMLPILARLKETEDQQRNWTRATVASFSIALPAMFGICAVASPLIAVFFGPQWTEAAIPMQLITIAGIADLTIHAVATMAIARKHLVFRSTLLVGLRALLIGTGSVAASLTFGSLNAIAGAVVLASLLVLLVQEFTVARPLGIGVGRLGLPLLRILAVCTVMLAVVQLALTTVLASPPPWVQLVVAIPLGVIVYGLAGLLIARSEVVTSMSQFARLVRGR